MIEKLKNLFTKKQKIEVNPDPIKVLGIREYKDGSVDVDLDISGPYDEFVHKEAEALGLSIEDFLVKLLYEYIERSYTNKNVETVRIIPKKNPKKNNLKNKTAKKRKVKK